MNRIEKKEWKIVKIYIKKVKNRKKIAEINKKELIVQKHMIF